MPYDDDNFMPDECWFASCLIDDDVHHVRRCTSYPTTMNLLPIQKEHRPAIHLPKIGLPFVPPNIALEISVPFPTPLGPHMTSGGFVLLRAEEAGEAEDAEEEAEEDKEAADRCVSLWIVVKEDDKRLVIIRIRRICAMVTLEENIKGL